MIIDITNPIKFVEQMRGVVFPTFGKEFLWAGSFSIVKIPKDNTITCKMLKELI